MKKILLFLLIANISFAQNSGVTADKFIIKPRIKTKKAKFITDKIYAQNSFFLGSDTTSQSEPFTITTNARFDGKMNLSGSYGQIGQYFKSGGLSLNPSWGYIDWSEITNKPTSVNSWTKVSVSGETILGIGNSNTDRFLFASNGVRVGEMNQYGNLYGFTKIGINTGFNFSASSNDFAYQFLNNYNLAIGGKGMVGYHTNMPSAQKTGVYYFDVAKQQSSDISKIRFVQYVASGAGNVAQWSMENGTNNNFSLLKLNTNGTADTTNSIYINAGRYNFGRSTGLNNSKFTFDGGVTFTGDAYFNSINQPLFLTSATLTNNLNSSNYTRLGFSFANNDISASDAYMNYFYKGTFGSIQTRRIFTVKLGSVTFPSDTLRINNILELNDIPNVKDAINSKLSTSTAASTYFPRTSGVLYGLTSIRKKTAYNSSDTLFVMGGLGSGFGEVGQGDKLEFKQVSFTGVPRWDISNFVGGTYQTNLTFSGQNIGIKRTNPAYNFDVNGTLRATGASSLDGNISTVGLGTIFNNSATLDIQAGSLATGGIRLGTSSATYVKLYTNGIDRLFINSAGNIGIGTTIPYHNLQVGNGTFSTNLNPNIQILAANSEDARVGAASSNGKSTVMRSTSGYGELYAYDYNGLVAQDLLLNQYGGNVGIGTSSPTGKLHVNGTGLFNGDLSVSKSDPNLNLVNTTSSTTLNIYGGAVAAYNFNNSNGHWFGTEGTYRLKVMSNSTSISNNLGVGTETPTARLHTSTTAQQNTFILESTHVTPTLAGTTRFSQNNRTGLNYRGELQITLQSHNGTAYFDNEVLTAKHDGKIGIGTTSPNAPLQFASTVANRKIVLFEASNDDNQYYGFGINSNMIRYQVSSTLNSHSFFAATSSTSSQQLLSINGDQTVTHTPLTTSQINALVKVDGKMAYNSDTDKPVWCNGTVWKYADGTNM